MSYEKEFEKSIRFLTDNGFMDANCRPTPMGEKVAKFGIDPYTALHIIKIRDVLNEYSETVDNPTLFALLCIAPEFTDNISVNSRIKNDNIAVENGGKFISMQSVNKIIGDDPYFVDLFDIRFPSMLKGFAMTYAEYLTSAYKCISIPSTNNDLKTIRESAERLVSIMAILVGNKWRFGKRLEMLVKGIELKSPVFDQDIIEMCQISGMGAKTLERFLSLGIDSVVKLAVVNPAVLFDKINEKKSGAVKMRKIGADSIAKFQAEARQMAFS